MRRYCEGSLAFLTTKQEKNRIGTNATFGSNFVGDFSVDMTMKFLEKQHALWDAVGIKVTSVSIGDPMGWCHPVKVEEIFGPLGADPAQAQVSGGRDAFCIWFKDGRGSGAYYAMGY